MSTNSRVRRVARRLGVAAFFTVAAVAPPWLAGSIGMRAAREAAFAGAATAPEAPVPDVRLPDGTRKTAVVLLGDSLTEATDFLVPYELLAASGEYQVYAVARERRPLRMFPGNVDVLPHLSYADYDARIGTAPDIIVVPYMEGDTDDAIAARREFLERYWPADNLLVTICGGSYTVARTGLLAGRRLTSHQNVLRLVRRAHPEVSWIDGARYVDDGDVISSAGIAAAFDALLYVLAREHGRNRALRVATDIGYPHTRFLDDPAYAPPAARYATTMLGAAYAPWQRFGVVVHDGASEIALAALTDTHPRTFAASLTTVAPELGYIETRHGLHIVPRVSFAAAARFHRVFVLGAADAAAQARLAAWAASMHVRPEAVNTGDEFVYDAALRDVARTQSRSAAIDAARGLEYPIGHLAIAASMPPLSLAARPLGLALLGVLTAWLLRAAVRRRWTS